MILQGRIPGDPSEESICLATDVVGLSRGGAVDVFSAFLFLRSVTQRMGFSLASLI